MAEPIPYPDPPLAGDGFVLRPYRVDDVPSYAAAVDDPSTARWLNSYASGDPAEDIRTVEADRAAGRMLVLTIADAVTDGYLGAIVLFAHEAGTGELAYLVAPEARGRNLARRSVQALGDWAVTELGLGRLQLRIDPENAASHVVAQRAGYQREGLLRSSFVLRGERKDAVMYSRLPSDPPPKP
jgi:RimJ/RimL family protein N-acetyltransferase